MPGFPDWQKIVQWIGNPLFESTGVAYSNVGQTNLGQQGLAPAFRSVLLVASNSTQNVRLDVVWFQTVSDLFGLFTQTVYVRASQTAAFILPARGHGFSVFGQGGNPGTIDLAAYPTNLEGSGVLVGGWPGIQGAGVLAQFNGNIGAATSVSFNLPPYFGAAQVAANVSSTAWQIWVDVLDQAGGFVGRPFVSALQNLGSYNQRFIMPPGLPTMNIANNQAAIVACTASILAPMDSSAA